MTIINTTVPYSLEDMRTMITTPDAQVVIDYDNSKLQGTAALIYLSNVNLHQPQLQVDDKDKYYQLIDNYVTLKSVLFVETLTYAVAGLLLFKVGCYDQLSVEEQNELTQLGLMTRDDYVAYLADETRASNVEQLMVLMQSILLFALSCSTEFTNAFGKVEDYFIVVDNVNYAGLTFIHLLGIDTFVFNFYSVPVTSLYYFKQQFQEYIYDGRSLFGVIREKQSPIIPLLDCILKRTITSNMIDQASRELAEIGA